MVVAECGVTEAEAERKQGQAIVIDVVAFARWVCVVEAGELADAAGKGNGEAARGVVLAE